MQKKPDKPALSESPAAARKAALKEQRDRIAREIGLILSRGASGRQGQRHNRKFLFTFNSQRFPAGDDDLQRKAGLQQTEELGSGGDHVLEVIQDQQIAALAQEPLQSR